MLWRANVVVILSSQLESCIAGGGTVGRATQFEEIGITSYTGMKEVFAPMKNSFQTPVSLTQYLGVVFTSNEHFARN